jgi:hypothetical protein
MKIAQLCPCPLCSGLAARPSRRQAGLAVDTNTPAIPGEAKSGGTERSWVGEFLRLSGWTVEQEPVHCADAPFTDVNL